MRALITGASGFLGGELTSALLERGYDLHFLGRGPHTSSRDLKKLGAYTEWNGNASDLVTSLLSLPTPDVVFHCAGFVATEHNSSNVQEMMSANVILITGLLEFISQTDAKPVLVNVGTYLEHSKDGSVLPNSLYAATKVAAGALIDYYSHAHGLRAITMKPSIIYGPSEERPRLMNLLAETTETGARLDMSLGHQIVDIIHVEDVVRSLIAAEKLLYASEKAQHDTFFALGGAPLSLRDLGAKFEQIMAQPLDINWGGKPYKQGEVMEPYLEGPTVPGWFPNISLEDGIQQLMQKKLSD